jgi:hypothetical protein
MSNDPTGWALEEPAGSLPGEVSMFDVSEMGPAPEGYQGERPPAHQAEQYAPTSFIPPADDFAPRAPPASPPPGRSYYGYRQPPTWQHASFGQEDGGIFGPAGGIFAARPNALLGVLGGLAQVGTAAALGYLLTSSWKGALGAGLGVAGAGQLPHALGAGGLTRFLIGAGGLVGAYFLLKPFAPALRSAPSAGVPAPWLRSNEPDDDEEDNDDSG